MMRGNHNLSLLTVMATVVLSLSVPAMAESPLDMVLDIDSEQTWLNPLWNGRHGPRDPQVRAALQQDLDQLDEPKTAIEAKKVKTNEGDQSPTVEDAPFKPDIPTWPHSVSIGSPTKGWLAYPERLMGSDLLSVREKANYGAVEMVDAIRQAADDVAAAFPNTPKLPVGDLSRKGGGLFRPHVSHQSGRDADIGYYLTKAHSERWLKHATPATLDVPRTWTFLASMMRDGRVEYIFLDYGLQRLLYNYAKNVDKLTSAQLDATFAYPRGPGSRTGIIRHLKGHADHMHVRFYAPESIAAVDEYIRRHGHKAIKPVAHYARVRSGDSLWKLAKRHRVTIKKLTRWNRISRRKTLKPGQKLIVGWRRPKLKTRAGS